MEGTDFDWSLLATELAEAGLPDLAAKAEAGYYDHFRSPLDTELPYVVLFDDLREAGTPAAAELWDRCIARICGDDESKDPRPISEWDDLPKGWLDDDDDE